MKTGMASSGSSFALQTNYLCKLCQSFNLNAIAGGTDYSHHSSLASLEISASDGCTFCSTIYHCLGIGKAAKKAALELENQQIYLQHNHVNMNTMPELGGHSAFDKLWVVCGESSSDPGGRGMWGQIELYTSRNSRLGKYFNGRDITLDPSSPENYSDVQRWLKNCSKHELCDKLSDRPLPKRLIDVRSLSENNVNLVVTQGQLGTYVALSYCWGRSPGHTTTKVTLEGNLKGISVDILPKTLADAVHITRRLGFRYIWIDALCIIQATSANDQDAIADWQDQCSKMADIYGNAFLTIVAAGASDKREGCFLQRVPDPYSSEINLTDDATEGKISARPLASTTVQIYKEVIEDRAWTFQEAALSQRLLIYGIKELSFKCKKSQITERLNLEVKDSKIFRGPQLFFSSAQASEERQMSLSKWYSSLRVDFCGRLITNDLDVLPALSGVAHRFQPKIGGAYYAGIWEVDILRGLLWKCGNVTILGKGKYLTRSAVYRAPSWSWASLKGAIYYQSDDRSMKKWEEEKHMFPAEIVEVRTTLVGPAYDPMGLVSDGFITIKGPVRTAVYVSKTDNRFRESFQVGASIRTSTSPPKANYELLVGDEVVDKLDPQAVGALGNFDVEEDRPLLYCVLLTSKEGLMLISSSKAPGQFERVGVFKLYRDDWFNCCKTSSITLI